MGIVMETKQARIQTTGVELEDNVFDIEFLLVFYIVVHMLASLIE